VQKRWKVRLGATAAAALALVGAMAVPAKAGPAAQNDLISLTVLDEQGYADHYVRGQKVTLKYQARARKALFRAGLEPEASHCQSSWGRMSNGQSVDFSCSVTPWADLVLFNKVEAWNNKGSKVKYLDHAYAMDVIDPKLSVQILDAPTPGGTLYVGQPTVLRARVQNVGDTNLTGVVANLGSCTQTIGHLPVGIFQEVECPVTVAAGTGTNGILVQARATGAPDLASYSPSNFQAVSTTSRNFGTFEPRADLDVEVLNADNGGNGWPAVNLTAPIRIRLTNRSNLPAKLSTTNDGTAPDCKNRTHPSWDDVPVNGSVILTCNVAVANSGGFSVRGRAELVGLNRSATADAAATLAVNPLQIFNVSINPSTNLLTFSVANYGATNVSIAAPNVTTYPGCTAPSWGNGSLYIPVNGTATFTCTAASYTASPAVRLRGYYNQQPFGIQYGTFPIFANWGALGG